MTTITDCKKYHLWYRNKNEINHCVYSSKEDRSAANFYLGSSTDKVEMQWESYNKLKPIESVTISISIESTVYSETVTFVKGKTIQDRIVDVIKEEAEKIKKIKSK